MGNTVIWSPRPSPLRAHSDKPTTDGGADDSMGLYHQHNDQMAALLRQLFKVGSTPVEVSELRAPARSFTLSAIEPLVEKGLIEFDTRTGIAFQTHADWDVIPTEAGLQILQPLTLDRRDLQVRERDSQSGLQGSESSAVS